MTETDNTPPEYYERWKQLIAGSPPRISQTPSGECRCMDYLGGQLEWYPAIRSMRFLDKHGTLHTFSIRRAKRTVARSILKRLFTGL